MRYHEILIIKYFDLNRGSILESYRVIQFSQITGSDLISHEVIIYHSSKKRFFSGRVRLIRCMNDRFNFDNRFSAELRSLSRVEKCKF